MIVGARADEEGSRSKERYFSPRSGENNWNIADQPPEFWNQYATEFAPGTHVRIHPLLDWTELDIWEYIERERIPTVALYYDQGKGERYRSLGCWPCTKAVTSDARNVAGDHRRAEERPLREHRRAFGPRAGQGRRRRTRVAPPRRLHVIVARSTFALTLRTRSSDLPCRTPHTTPP